MKTELTKEQAEHIFEYACSGSDENRLFLHAAARVLYGTPAKLDRVEIANEFMGHMLANHLTGEIDTSYRMTARAAIEAADAFMLEVEKWGGE